MLKGFVIFFGPTDEISWCDNERMYENIVIGGIYRLKRNQQHACCHKLACDCKRKLVILQNKFVKHSQVDGKCKRECVTIISPSLSNILDYFSDNCTWEWPLFLPHHGPLGAWQLVPNKRWSSSEIHYMYFTWWVDKNKGSVLNTPDPCISGVHG